MVIENQEMVMEKSWKNILSSLWEPCYVDCPACKSVKPLILCSGRCNLLVSLHVFYIMNYSTLQRYQTVKGTHVLGSRGGLGPLPGVEWSLCLQCYRYVGGRPRQTQHLGPVHCTRKKIACLMAGMIALGATMENIKKLNFNIEKLCKNHIS